MYEKQKDMPVKFSFRRIASHLGPVIKPYFESLVSYTAKEIKDTLFFEEQIIEPAFLCLLSRAKNDAASITLTKNNFYQLFYSLKEELVVTMMNAVILVDDFHTKFSKVLNESVRKMVM